MRSVVDFPQPDGPSSTANCALSMRKLTSSTAHTPGVYALVTLSSSTLPT